MAEKIEKTKSNVMNLLEKLDTMIYEFGDKLL